MDIGRDLRSVNNRICRFVEKHASRHMTDVTFANGWIIGYIDHHADRDVFQRDMEAEFDITRSTASKVIDLMVKKGLIERQSVPYDARLKKLVLTARAQEIAAAMREEAMRTEAILKRGFSAEELETLHGYLERIKQNISEGDNEP